MSTSPVCNGCVNNYEIYNDGTGTHERRCRLDGAQSGTYMAVFTEAGCDGFGKPKVQMEADRYPLRKHVGKSVDTLRSDNKGVLKESLTLRERMQDQPMFRRKKHYNKKR